MSLQEAKDHHMKESARAIPRGGMRKRVMDVIGASDDDQIWDDAGGVPAKTSFASSSSSSSLERGSVGWANLPPELLLDIVSRVESAGRTWPSRRDLVAWASVCRSWRHAAKEVTCTPEQSGCLTFPASLKQPGPRDTPIQCFIRRERSTSTYWLYLGLTPALSGDMSKLLLVARKIRRAMSTEFVVSLAPNEFSRASNTYFGKLRSNFLGTKFTIYDSQPPITSSFEAQSKSRAKKTHWRSTNNLKQVSPRMPVGNFSIGTVSYELNVLRTRGPRRMRCTMHSIPISAVSGESSSSAETWAAEGPNENPKGNKAAVTDPSPRERDQRPLVLKNKAPRWHEQLQCWCLNFKGRVTVASVKNFQLVATATDGGSGAVPLLPEQENVILQFGKIGKDIFTMDYCYPLSAFQAFAICLSSYDTKPAC